MTDPSATTARWVDAACRRFEKAWHLPGQPPRIEDFLPEGDDARLTVLLRELVSIDLELRLQRGETPAADDYLERFPAHRALITEILADALGSGTPTFAPSSTAVSSVPDCLGAYRIVREIGRGGMGIVYEAIHEPLNRRVALKVLRGPAGWDAPALQRFRREARIVARLQHPSFVPVHDVGQEQGIHYYVMAYVEGHSLAQVVAAVRSRTGEAPPPLDDPTSTAYSRAVSQIALEVAEALRHAHEQGILHRDIKPSNLLLGADGKVRIADFGLACSRDDSVSLTGSGQLLGTLRYLAPEALEGNWQPASDVYSLGLTLYELLTLRPAFNAPNHLLLLNQLVHASPPAPRQLNPHIPPRLEAIVLRTIDRDLEKRYATAAELASDLRTFLADPSIPSQRRQRFRALAACVLLVGVVALLASYLGGAFHRAAPGWGANADVVTKVSPTGLVHEDLPGLVLHPARLAGGQRWQLETICARDHLYGVAWSPDSRQLACAGGDGQLRIVEVEGQRLRLQRLLLGHHSLVHCVTWSRTGRLASASEDQTIRVWEPDGRLVTILRGYPGDVLALAWSPDGKALLSGGSDGTVRVWDVGRGQARVIYQEPTAHVHHLSWSADGRYLAAAFGQTVRVWQIDGSEVQEFDHGHVLWSLAFLPQGHQLATSGRDRRVRLWQPGRKDPVAVLDIPAFYMALHPDGKHLVAVPDNAQAEAYLWSLDGQRLRQLVALKSGLIRNLRWAPDGNSLGIGCVGGDILVWRTDGERHLGTFLPTPREMSVAWGPDGQLATGAPVAIWSGDGARTRRIEAGRNAARVSWSADGRWIAGEDTSTRCINILTPEGDLVRQVPSSTSGVLSRDGRLAVQSPDKREYQVWNTDGILAARTPSGPRGLWTSGMAWNTAGDRLAVTALGVVYLWDPERNEGLKLLADEGTQGMGAPAWSPDGRWLAAINQDRILLHRGDGAPHLRWLAHPILHTLAWSPDSSWLVSAGGDRTIRLWKPTGEAGPILANRQFCTERVAWDRHDRLATVSGHGTLFVWQFRDGRLHLLWMGMLAGEQAVAFDATGQLIQGSPSLLEEHFVHVVEGPTGALDLLTPAEFQRHQR